MGNQVPIGNNVALYIFMKQPMHRETVCNLREDLHLSAVDNKSNLLHRCLHVIFSCRSSCFLIAEKLLKVHTLSCAGLPHCTGFSASAFNKCSMNSNYPCRNHQGPLPPWIQIQRKVFISWCHYSQGSLQGI